MSSGIRRDDIKHLSSGDVCYCCCCCCDCDSDGIEESSMSRSRLPLVTSSSGKRILVLLSLLGDATVEILEMFVFLK
ncbi:hypothetical protein RRG08_056907 [Elysia crispata]|uniref:Uncharacterized protein n=1 Tax=Elysia crispata TaxID=231223 RepID=A0AAE0Y944_9GAST|nr:hypothetical protein RRG08_056907 [Elysia crispata]